MITSQLLHALEPLLAVTPPATAPALSIPEPPGAFSRPLAAGLADLCREATARTRGVVVRDEGQEQFVAFPSGETWDWVGIDPGTVGQHEAGPAGGKVFGPLARSLRMPEMSRGPRLWIAGHGAGGAHAQLAAAAWHREGFAVGAIYSFGAPRTGDTTFRETLAMPHYRIVNNQDPIPDLPPPGPWRHHGTHLLIHDDGSLDRNPTPFSRAGLFLRQSAWLVELLADGLHGGYPRALHSLLQRVLADHCLDRYAERLRAAT